MGRRAAGSLEQSEARIEQDVGPAWQDQDTASRIGRNVQPYLDPRTHREPSFSSKGKDDVCRGIGVAHSWSPQGGVFHGILNLKRTHPDTQASVYLLPSPYFTNINLPQMYKCSGVLGLINPRKKLCVIHVPPPPHYPQALASTLPTTVLPSYLLGLTSRPPHSLWDSELASVTPGLSLNLHTVSS